MARDVRGYVYTSEVPPCGDKGSCRVPGTQQAYEPYNAPCPESCLSATGVPSAWYSVSFRTSRPSTSTAINLRPSNTPDRVSFYRSSMWRPSSLSGGALTGNTKRPAHLTQ